MTYRLYPLRWIPTLYNADPREREKYEIHRNRTMLVWDPEKCAINDELRIADGHSAGQRRIRRHPSTPTRLRAGRTSRSPTGERAAVGR